jgi:hypothetical protein
MARFVFGMMQSLDGYVAGPPGGPELPMPGPALHRHFNDHVRGLAGCLYGRRLYEMMRYWDDERRSGTRSRATTPRRGGLSPNGSCPAR